MIAIVSFVSASESIHGIVENPAHDGEAVSQI